MANINTWIVVADSAHAKIYVNHGRGRGVDESPIKEFIGDNQPTRDINSDQPGRTFDSAGGGARHANEPRTDAHRHAQQLLAHEIASFLDDAANRDTYAQLVLVAPPRALGDLRASLSAKVQAKLVGDLNKNLL